MGNVVFPAGILYMLSTKTYYHLLTKQVKHSRSVFLIINNQFPYGERELFKMVEALDYNSRTF